MKRPFQFYLPDGTIETNTNTDYLKSLDMTDDFINQRQQQYEAHLTSEMYHERKWRNRQLRDVLYIKQLQVMDEAVLDKYIEALKAYDLKYQPRPEPDPVLRQAGVMEEWLV